jgi:hypothetical protein
MAAPTPVQAWAPVPTDEAGGAGASNGGMPAAAAATRPTLREGSATAQAAGGAADAPPARVIRAHLGCDRVKKSFSHKAARVLGIHMRGDVATNEVTTGKYTLLTFLPVNLFEQFMRVANAYFLLMAILQVSKAQLKQ